MSNLKKYTILLLIVTLLFSGIFTTFNSSSANAETIAGNVEVLVNNPQKIKLKMGNEGVIGFLEFDKESREITYKTNEKNKEGKNEKEYLVEIEEATSEGVIAEFTDTDDNTTYEYNSVEAIASWGFLLPLGVAIGGALIEHLIGLGLALIIGGVAYIAYEEFIDRKKDYNHYSVYLDTKKNIIFFGNGISATKAINRLKSGFDTWSTSKTNAQSVAQGASPIGKVIGPEIDMRNGTPRSGYFYHYHVANEILLGKYTRLGGYDDNNTNGVHAFYGGPY